MNIFNLPDDSLRSIFYYVKSDNILEKLVVSKKISILIEKLHKDDHDIFFQFLNEQPGSARALREIYASEASKSPRDQIIALFRKQHFNINHFTNLKSIIYFFPPSGDLKKVLVQYKKNEEQLDRPIAKSLYIMLNLICKDRYLPDNYKTSSDTEKREIDESYLEENLDKIKTLKVLDYSKFEGNALFHLCYGIPPHVALLTNLEKVKLSGHRVSNDPNQLLAFHSIKKIDLATTYFGEFPKQLLELKNLETIRISNNYIYEIPSDISKLTKLKKLYLTNNRLSELPKELLQLTCLDKIFLIGNPITRNVSAMKQLKEHIWLNRNISIFPVLQGGNSVFSILPKEILQKILINKCDVETTGQLEGVRTY